MPLTNSDLLAVYREATSTAHKLTIDELKGFVADDFEVPSSSTPPLGASPGDLWFNETDESLYYYYDNGNTKEWVIANPDSPSDVESVNGKTGVVVLDADDVGALETGDDVSELVNDAGYIVSTGDNMVGDLTLGTDKIKLDATTGDAEFVGKLTSASTEDTDTGTTLVTKDYLSNSGTGTEGNIGFWNRTGNDLSPLNAGDSIKVGGTLPSAPNIHLNANGTLTAVIFDLDSLPELQ